MVRQLQFTPYDVLDRRIAKSVNGSSTQFVYDGDNVILEFNGTAIPSMRYLQGPGVDQTLAQEGNGQTSWMLTDHLGTVRDLVNNSGTVVNHFTYDSFGQVLNSTPGGVDTRYKYTGREFDAETGLYYYRARYFDASVGRFIGQDPLSFGGDGPNLYAYVLNHPTDRVDPFGEVSKLANAEVDSFSFSRVIKYKDRTGYEKTVLHIDDVVRARKDGRFSYITSDETKARIYGTNRKGSGSGVSEKVYPLVPDLRKGLDDAGHIIGRKLGGTGKSQNNLFSQEQKHNRGHAGTYHLW